MANITHGCQGSISTTTIQTARDKEFGLRSHVPAVLRTAEQWSALPILHVLLAAQEWSGPNPTRTFYMLQRIYMDQPVDNLDADGGTAYSARFVKYISIAPMYIGAGLRSSCKSIFTHRGR